jgi:adenylate kinase family enzyme
MPGLLKAALGDAKHTKVLIDGFPRVLDQLTEFESRVRPG